MRFCRENLWNVTENTFSLAEAKYSNQIFSAKILNNNQDTQNVLKISKLHDNGFRFFVELPDEKSKYRYDIFHDDLIVNKSKFTDLDDISYSTDHSGNHFLKYDDFTIQISPNPLSISMKKGVMNYIDIFSKDPFFVVEDGSSVPDEVWQDKTEKIPHGKTSVGISFTFDSSAQLSGLSIDNMTLDIEDTKETRRFARDANLILQYSFVPFLFARGHKLEYVPAVFWMNPSDTFYSVQTKSIYRNVRLLSEGGYIDFVVFIANFTELFKQYTDLTGRPNLPPGWALGYHQSKWGYKNQTEVEEVMQNFTISNIPYDGFWLDIDHLDHQTPLTMSSEWFDNSSKLFNKFKNTKRGLIRITDPHMKVDADYAPYNECVEKGFLIQYNNSEFQDWCWPGNSAWPDFLRSDVRDWWSSKFTSDFGYPENIYAWNDMNEPSTWTSIDNTLPKDSLHLNNTIENREIHSIYGLSMTAGTFKGFMTNRPNKRPFVLTRSYFAGSQKFAWHWSGDNYPTWSAYRQSIDSLLTTNINGMFFSGSDLGGFMENTTDELLLKWFQLGSLLYPLYREHSHTDTVHREPYLFNNTDLDMYKSLKKAISDRYSFIPFFYTAMEETVRTGIPFARPLWFEFPKEVFEKNTAKYQPLVGGRMMICPVLEENQTEIEVVKPPGRWFNLRNGKELTEDTKFDVNKYDDIFVFIREGTITANYSSIGMSVHETVDNEITLIISVDEDMNSQGTLYFDDMETFDYKENKFLRVNMSFHPNEMNIEVSGDYKKEVICNKIIIYGLKHAPYFSIDDSKVLFDGVVCYISELKLNIGENHNFKVDNNSKVILISTVTTAVILIIILIVIIVVFTRRKQGPTTVNSMNDLMDEKVSKQN
ncbi:Glycosyl hydrolases family 31 protein [Trichomonas vaginalis G3]|uniref:Maltase n=1 Tax=Trichomonas vaginalis (strain ATCC PRA-98 / G3) TaxID=412133 RepID=A2DC83_TRIV3|nr:glycosyl hydrolase [Trichomonas vaginalis G3]EAY22124.1 Glycosyl hydrolases family 31 protein [Trichomonas vaginalis G3]KAI5525209.1 alpha-glucosidase family [Trichomonas vaginalis G3]|eukprot:XP_001583110.1 glycosyl hydrolase [Trichomonas vaginalis G3]